MVYWAAFYHTSQVDLGTQETLFDAKSAEIARPCYTAGILADQTHSSSVRVVKS